MNSDKILAEISQYCGEIIKPERRPTDDEYEIATDILKLIKQESV
jgi:hypothetical protein